MKNKIILGLMAVCVMSTSVFTQNVNAASMSDVPFVWNGWAMDSDRVETDIASVPGASYKNTSKKKYKHATVKNDYTTSRSISGSLSSTINAGLSGKGNGAEASLSASVTATIGVTLSSSYTSSVSQYPTSSKYGKNYIDPKTHWTTKVVTKGVVLSGYAIRRTLGIKVQSGSFNVKMPTGYRCVYTYKKLK